MTIAPVDALSLLAPDFLDLSIVGVAWFVALRISRERQSRGMFLVSLGFLVYLVLNASWTVIYWTLLGGPFEYVNLYQAGLSPGEIGAILSMINLAYAALFAISLGVMVSFIVYGASRIGQTPPVEVEAAGR